MAALSVTMAYGQKPVCLTTDLIKHTDRVTVGGYPSAMSLGETASAVEDWRVPLVRSAQPNFGWVVPHGNDIVQQAYRVLVASRTDILARDSADVWDSGRVADGNSVCVTYGGERLRPSTVYYWKVKTWDRRGAESDWSDVRAFMTADTLDDAVSYYPLEKTDCRPIATREDDGRIAADWGTDAFAQLSLVVDAEGDDDTLIVHIGEQTTPDGRVNRSPDGSQRYARYVLPLLRGEHTYHITLRKDRRNTTPGRNESAVSPILMPAYIGEVYPFRYCEIESVGNGVTVTDIVRHVVHYPFDWRASSFESTDSVLNMVWALCKHTVFATSFAGIYVDGDRERIPYEADAVINQLSHYAADREYTMARRTVRHLIHNPTWPTEWSMQTLIMAWNDYMYTGDDRLLTTEYDDLKAKTLIALRERNGLISTTTGRADSAFYASVHFRGKTMRDIVDWPQTGAEGVEKECGGEADGFVFSDYNTVVNAYHYNALRLMAQIAKVVGHDDDATLYGRYADSVKTAVNNLLRDPVTGLYNDGVTTDHRSLHSNMFALCFGLVDDEYKDSVVTFVKSRGMACSVYGAQFLLDALYDAGEDDYALSLLRSTSRRSWYNMIRIGSTITTEAWDNVYKPNQDWNHPWGAAAMNVIARKLMGIEPAEPGFAVVRVKPAPGTLDHAAITVPTVRGEITVSFNNVPDSVFAVDVNIPANSTAEVWLPAFADWCTVDGRQRRAWRTGDSIVVTVGSGAHSLRVEK